MKDFEENSILRKELEKAQGRGKRREEETNYDTFDYASLAKRIVPLSVWRISMEYSGLVDEETGYIIGPRELKDFPNARHSFRIEVNIPNTNPLTDGPDIRFLKDYQGLPKSEDVLL